MIRVGAHGRRYFGSVGPLGLLLLLPAFFLLVVGRFALLLIHLTLWLVLAVVRLVVQGVVWGLRKSRREETWSSRRDEG